VNRKPIVLSALILIGAGIGTYQYLQRLEEQRIAQAREETAHAIILAMKQRQEAARLSPQQEEQLVSEAKTLLDEGELARASMNLDRVLKSNPRNVRAHIEMARFHIMSGHINYRNFQPGSLEKAAMDLQRAMGADPKSADAYVLWGHLLYLRGASREALKALEKAETLGTENPWLYLNWADALMDIGQWSAAESKLRKAQARYDVTDPPTRIRSAVHDKLSSVLSYQGKLDEADKEFLTVIMLEPGSAANHGNYADFLLFRRGLPDAAIAEAQQALNIANYRMAQLTLAAASYAKWAELKRRDSRKAAEYLSLAQGITSDFSWIMPQAAKSVDAGPAIRNMVKSLMELGVSINTKDERGDTGLTLAADEGNVKSVVLLAQYGANLDAADNAGRTALASAAYKSHTGVVKALAIRGARVDAQDHNGHSPLHFTVTNRDEDMIRTLISLKANVNVATSQGYTPLMNAAFSGDLGIARLLVDAGADPNAVTKDKQQTAADIAAARGHEEVAKYLRDAAKRGAPTAASRASSYWRDLAVLAARG
jgi:tetratricopeptide (TPR) repeat protein